jgi:hypothetical protein
MLPSDRLGITRRPSGRRGLRRLIGGTVETAAAFRAIAVRPRDAGDANGTHGHGSARSLQASMKIAAPLGVIIVASEKYRPCSRFQLRDLSIASDCRNEILL